MGNGKSIALGAVVFIGIVAVGVWAVRNIQPCLEETESVARGLGAGVCFPDIPIEKIQTIPPAVLAIFRADHNLSRVWIYSCMPSTPRMESVRSYGIVCEAQGYFIRVVKDSKYLHIDYMLQYRIPTVSTVVKEKRLSNTTVLQLERFLATQSLKYNSLDANCQLFAEEVYASVS